MRRFVQPRNQRVFNRLVGLLHHRVSDSLEFSAGLPLRIPGSGSKTVADPQKQLHVLNGAFQIPFWLRDVSDLVVVVRNVFIDEPIAITRWLGPRVGPHDSLLRRGCLYDQVIHRRLARADERDVSRAAPRVDDVEAGLHPLLPVVSGSFRASWQATVRPNPAENLERLRKTVELAFGRFDFVQVPFATNHYTRSSPGLARPIAKLLRADFEFYGVSLHLL